MATGIVSLAAHLMGLAPVAQALFLLNIVFYAVLWVLAVARATRFPRRFFSDMVDHLRGPGYFTMVAATGVLGSQCVLLTADRRAACSGRVRARRGPAPARRCSPACGRRRG